MSTYAPSSAYLSLNLQGAVGTLIGTRIGAFGICLRNQVPALYPDYDPPGVGDTNGRQFNFKPSDELFIYGKLFRTDNGTGVGNVSIILRLIDQYGTTQNFYTTTGSRLGEFSFNMPPNSIGSGSWTISIEFDGA